MNSAILNGCIATLALLSVSGTAIGLETGREPDQKPVTKPAEQAEPVTPAVLTIPTDYTQNRFFAVPVTESGVTMKFMISTGGRTMIYSDAVASVGTPISLGPKQSSTEMPSFDAELSIPTPRGDMGALPIVASRYRRAYLPSECSGVLGDSWFADRVWTFDYPDKRVHLRPIGDLPKVDTAHVINMGFRTSGLRSRENNLPRIDVYVSGKRLNLLLDTGASVMLDKKALASLDDKRPSVRAMSFISQSQLDAWKKEHNWPVIESSDGTAGGSMIEVPKIMIGGHEVGPVWFMARRDVYFSNEVSRELDNRVTGILGGNALKFFRLTLDFPAATAMFERP